MTDGLVSAALEAELLGETRRRGIVIWLDKDATYTPFVDDLVKATPQVPYASPSLPSAAVFSS